MIDKISVTHANRKAYSALQDGIQDGKQLKGRKEVQCSFCLLNLLFSDTFAEDFATLGNAATQQQLDSGGVGNDEHFWVRVQAAFVEPHPDYDYLDFVTSNDVFLSQDHIDPAKIVHHDWKKLRSIWKGVNAD